MFATFQCLQQKNMFYSASVISQVLEELLEELGPIMIHLVKC